MFFLVSLPLVPLCSSLVPLCSTHWCHWFHLFPAGTLPPGNAPMGRHVIIATWATTDVPCIWTRGLEWPGPGPSPPSWSHYFDARQREFLSKIPNENFLALILHYLEAGFGQNGCTSSSKTWDPHTYGNDCTYMSKNITVFHLVFVEEIKASNDQPPLRVPGQGRWQRFPICRVPRHGSCQERGNPKRCPMRSVRSMRLRSVIHLLCVSMCHLFGKVKNILVTSCHTHMVGSRFWQLRHFSKISCQLICGSQWAPRKELLQLLRGFAHLGSDEPIVLPELPTKMWSKLVGIQGPWPCAKIRFGDVAYAGFHPNMLAKYCWRLWLWLWLRLRLRLCL